MIFTQLSCRFGFLQVNICSNSSDSKKNCQVKAFHLISCVRRKRKEKSIKSVKHLIWNICLHGNMRITKENKKKHSIYDAKNHFSYIFLFAIPNCDCNCVRWLFFCNMNCVLSVWIWYKIFRNLATLDSIRYICWKTSSKRTFGRRFLI